MFRRRSLLRRPLVRRPLLGAAVVGGLGFLIGRRRSAETSGSAAATADPSDRLAALERLHETGSITDEEYAMKRADLLREL